MILLGNLNLRTYVKRIWLRLYIVFWCGSMLTGCQLAQQSRWPCYNTSTLETQPQGLAFNFTYLVHVKKHQLTIYTKNLVKILKPAVGKLRGRRVCGHVDVGTCPHGHTKFWQPP